MSKYARISELEKEIAVRQAELNALMYKTHEKVSRGDYVVILNDKEWVCSKGDIMWVDEVRDGHIMCRSKNPKYRSTGIFWISNSEWAKSNFKD